MYRITIKCWFLLYHFLVIGADTYFNPHKEGDFCNLPCNQSYYDEDYGNITIPKDNLACSCRKSPRCRRLPINSTQLQMLRDNFWRAINFYRDSYTESDDMNSVNYDLSLEYQSYCHAMRCHRVAESQACERTKKFPVGLNRFIIWKYGKEIPYKYATVKLALQNVFSAQYPRTTNGSRVAAIPYQDFNITFRNYACLVWSTYTHFGCAVALQVNAFHEVIAHTIVCNIAGPVLCATKGVQIFSPSPHRNDFCRKCPPGKEECIIGPYHDSGSSYYDWHSMCGKKDEITAEFWEEAKDIIDPSEPIKLDPIGEFPIEYIDVKETDGSETSKIVHLNPFYIIIFLIVIM